MKKKVGLPLGATLVGAVAVLASFILGYRIPTSCPRFQFLAAFAGSAARFEGGLASSGCDSLTLGEARTAAFVSLIPVIVIGFVLWRLLYYWWPLAWRADPLRSIRTTPRIAIAGTALAAIACLIIGFGLDAHEATLSLRRGAALALPVVSWAAALLLVVAGVMAANAVIGGIGSWNVPIIDEGEEEKQGRKVRWTAPKQPKGFGICCSGGGIRAASVSLGVLSVLEQTAINGQPGDYVGDERDSGSPTVLDSADYLSSVSGGGYAAGAWRIARGTSGSDKDLANSEVWPNGIIGLPDYEPPPKRYDEPDTASERSLYRRFLARRSFLTTGPGGLSATLVWVLLGVLAQFLILAILVYAVSWPLGRVAGSWAVLAGDLQGGVQGQWRFYGPTIVWLAFGLLVFAARSWMLPTGLRSRIEAVAGSAALLGLAIAIPLLLLPAAIAALEQRPLSEWVSAAVVAFTGGVGAVTLPIVTSRLRKIWTYLGGVLLAIVMLVSAALVVRWAANLHIAAEESGQAGAWWLGYLVVLAGLAAISYLLQPRWWSLHEIYRRRLRDAFAVTTDRESAPGFYNRSKKDPDLKLYPLASTHEPALHKYGSSSGPTPLICASVARDSRTATGVPALAFVMSPKSVHLYDVTTVNGQPQVSEYSTDTETYLEAMKPDRLGAGFGITTAMAISGAAFAPAMGRHSLGTTNALLAALNVRLGVWLPSLSYSKINKPARLNYLFKELLGWYDLRDPFVFATDGGHRENLGLVELLRRRCKLILAIDASGDPPGSFATLWQALLLAGIECQAEIRLDEEKLADLRMAPNGQFAKSCVLVIPIEYSDDDGQETKGTLIYLKSVVHDGASPGVKAFSQEDPLFPDYSTGNQFINETQFRYLFELGRSMAFSGLRVDLNSGRPALEVIRECVTGTTDSRQEAVEQFCGEIIELVSDEAFTSLRQHFDNSSEPVSVSEEEMFLDEWLHDVYEHVSRQEYRRIRGAANRLRSSIH